jgi:hypothetical protein
MDKGVPLYSRKTSPRRPVLATCAVLVFATSANAWCYSEVTDEESQREDAISSPEVIEEIFVYGEMNVIQLRNTMYRVEEQFLDTFNSLTTEPDFKFKCDWKVSLATRRRSHVCRPRYHERNEAAATRGMRMSGMLLADHEGIKLNRKMDEKLVNEMLTLLSENPELMDAYRELDRVRDAYELKLNPGDSDPNSN